MHPVDATPDATPDEPLGPPQRPIARTRRERVRALPWLQLGAWLYVTLLNVTVNSAIMDGDGWWHLATGRWIEQRGSIPLHDPFSWVAGGREWINQEWLSNGLFWLAWRLGGQSAALLLACAVASGAWLAAWQYCRLRGASGVGAGSMAVLLIAPTILFTTVRPVVWSWLFSILLVYWVERWIRTERPLRELWLLLPLGVLWANLHGAFIYGPAIIGWYALWLLGGVGYGRLGTRGTPLRAWYRRSLSLLAAAIGMYAAAALNPVGPALWAYPLQGLLGGVNNKYVLEWLSPDFHNDFHFMFLVWLVGAWSIVGLSAVALSIPKEGPAWAGRWTAALRAGGQGVAGPAGWALAAVFTLASLIQWRHEILALFIGGGVVAPLLAGALGTTRPRRRVVAGWALFGAVFCIAPAWWSGWRGAAYWNNAIYYPTTALSVPLVRSLLLRPETKLYNFYGWGGYFIWEGISPAIDGREYVYPEAWILRYLAITGLQPGWKEAFNETRANVVCFPRASSFAAAVEDLPGWRVWYQDSMTTVLTSSHVTPSPEYPTSFAGERTVP